jgi:hypothetical protein
LEKAVERAFRHVKFPHIVSIRQAVVRRGGKTPKRQERVDL